MKVQLYCIGKTSSSAIDSLVADYEARLKHYIKFEVSYLELPKKTKANSEEELKQMEGEMLLSKIDKSSRLILLDEAGKGLTSKGFANLLQSEMNRGVKAIAFCIGGAYGFSSEVYSRADQKISLSQMTFTHQMVRLFFTEQLYRAMTILRGEKYHH